MDMSRRFLAGVLLVVAALVVVAAVGAAGYRAGVVHGLAESGRLAPDTGPGTPGPWRHGPWAYGPMWLHGPFAFLGFVFPLLGVLLVLGVARALLWGPCGGWRRDAGGVPAVFEDWHRRAHEAPRDRGHAT
jgi:hypothetical protein